MARPREFNADEALEKAFELFWRKGYAETSMRDLSEFTGVAHAGLYSAFGDKRSLYAKVLEKYRDSLECSVYLPLEAAGAGLVEIEAFFASVAAEARDGGLANGCFLANTGIAFAHIPGAESELFVKHVERMSRAFETALRQAQGRGEIASVIDAKVIAAAFVTTFNGLAVLARAGAPLISIERSIAAALAQLR